MYGVARLGNCFPTRRPSTLKRIPTEESGSDLFRSDEPDGAAFSYHIESPQSVVQGSATQGSAVGPGEKE
jgi:hypothetical protein